MHKAIQGRIDGSKARVGVVVARFNSLVTERLLEGALSALERAGVSDPLVVSVPGAYEVPQAAATLLARDNIDGVITLGCVIRGGTAHFEYVAGPCANGVLRAGMDAGKPCVFGVLTTDDTQQALERAGGKMGNKGEEAAMTVLEMIGLQQQLAQQQPATAR